MSDPERRLAELGLTLAEPVKPVANYVPFVRSGGLVYVSGQVSLDGGGGVRGVVGEDVDLATAQHAAKLCGAQPHLPAEGGGRTATWSRVRRIRIKLGGFVQAGPGFFEIPQVLNGCSDLMVAVFGEAGRHARSAVGVYRLPMNFAVEVDAVAEVT